MNFSLFCIFVASVLIIVVNNLVSCTIKIITDNQTVVSAFLNYQKTGDNTILDTDVNPLCKENKWQNKFICQQVLEALKYELDEKDFPWYRSWPCFPYTVKLPPKRYFAYLLRCPSRGTPSSYYVSYAGGLNETNNTTMNLLGLFQHGRVGFGITYSFHTYIENVELLKSEA